MTKKWWRNKLQQHFSIKLSHTTNFISLSDLILHTSYELPVSLRSLLQHGPSSSTRAKFFCLSYSSGDLFSFLKNTMDQGLTSRDSDRYHFQEDIIIKIMPLPGFEPGVMMKMHNFMSSNANCSLTMRFRGRVEKIGISNM